MCFYLLSWIKCDFVRFANQCIWVLLTFCRVSTLLYFPFEILPFFLNDPFNGTGIIKRVVIIVSEDKMTGTVYTWFCLASAAIILKFCMKNESYYNCTLQWLCKAKGSEMSESKCIRHTAHCKCQMWLVSAGSINSKFEFYVYFIITRMYVVA